jgi:hypothetical protein
MYVAPVPGVVQVVVGERVVVSTNVSGGSCTLLVACNN